MANSSRIWATLVALVLIGCCACEARNANLGYERGAVDAPTNYACDACMQFSTEAQMILSDPDTQRRAVDLVSQMACNSLISGLKKKCLDLVSTYVPDAITALQAYLGPEICVEAGLCQPETSWMPHLTLKAPRRPVALAADTKACSLCEDFAGDALTYLGSNVTKSKIMGALHLACAKLEDISQQCDLLVDIYAPTIMDHLDSLTPEEVCQLTHVCKPSLTPKPDKHACKVAGVTRNDCAICQFVVLELKIKLRDPTVQAKILDVLMKGCNRVQNHVDECKLIVGQYAPFILSNLDTLLDADTLCTKLRACPAQLKLAVEPVLTLPSEWQNHHHRFHDHQHRQSHQHRLVHSL